MALSPEHGPCLLTSNRLFPLTTRVRWSGILISFQDLLVSQRACCLAREALGKLSPPPPPPPSWSLLLWCKVRGQLFLHRHLEAI